MKMWNKKGTKPAMTSFNELPSAHLLNLMIE